MKRTVITWVGFLMLVVFLVLMCYTILYENNSFGYEESIKPTRHTSLLFKQMQKQKVLYARKVEDGVWVSDGIVFVSKDKKIVRY